MGFSIEDGIHAWKRADIDPALIAAQNRWKPEEAGERLASLLSDHADPVRLDATLARLPVPSLAILATLVELGGTYHDDSVMAEAEHRFGIGREALSMAIGPLLREVLLLVLGSESGRSFTLVEPSAALIASRVRDLDVAPLPPDVPSVPSERSDGGRALLAVCCALRHVDIKLTQAGAPHRAAVKRFAKAVGLDDDQVDERVMLGLELELLRRDEDEVLRPVFPRLRELAEGLIPARSPVLARLADELRVAGQPVPFELVERWIRDAGRFADRGILRPAQLGAIPGLRAGTVGDVATLELAPPAGVAAASITPSFEVFVPPEARNEHLVDVLACAEVVRIDRAIVGRITKTSIQRAVAGGATSTSILAGLAAAARTPVPANVASAIADWAAGPHAVTAVGRVVVVPAADEARALAALEVFHPRAIAPGIIIVPEAFPARGVAAALSRTGIGLQIADAGEEELDDDLGDADAEALPPLVSGDPELRRRFAEYRATAATERASATEHGPGPGERDEEMVSDRAMAVIEAWERARRCTLPDDLATAAAALVDVVSEPDQRFLIAAKDMRELVERLDTIIRKRGGLKAFLDANRDLVASIVGPEMTARLLAEQHGASAAWHTHDLHGRLTAAARTCASYQLDLGGGRIPTVRIQKVINRGKVTMVLGEDIADESAIAVPLTSITRIAEAEVTAQSSGPWRALDGQLPPPGHVPCPCGSGARYRACCRPKN